MISLFLAFSLRKQTIESFNNVKLTPTVMSKFPALNGIGISMVRAEVGAKGSYSMHTHYVATEFLIMVAAELTDGLVIDEEVFEKTIKAGEWRCYCVS